MPARAPWPALAALFVVVSLAVYGIAQWQPFAPEAPAAAEGPAGDPVAGEALFAGACAVCHGTGGSGGVGPRLIDTGVTAAQAAAVVASGRGSMPAGLLEGTEAADVAAYVGRISAGESGAAPGPGGDTGGLATITAPRLSGLTVRLDSPAPTDWTVWIDGPAGLLRVGAIGAGAREARAPAVEGGRVLVGRYDRVLVGADAQSPALEGTLGADRADELLGLLVDDPRRPGADPVVDGGGAQVDVLREHVRFLVAARDEGNLANVRFHGEHLVNIARGEPLRDLDGNGEASNPGDGVGLIDGQDAYLRRIGILMGPALSDRDRAAAALVTRIARDGARSGQADSVAVAAPFVAAIERADAALDTEWARLRAAAEGSAVVPLESR